eukprot:UN04547
MSIGTHLRLDIRNTSPLITS